MRKVRFTGHQIIAVLKSVEAGLTAKDVGREAAISEARYDNWKEKYGGTEAPDIRKIKDLIPKALNRWGSIDFMHDALTCGGRFRIFNVADDVNREALPIEIDLNIPAQRVVPVLDRIGANRG